MRERIRVTCSGVCRRRREVYEISHKYAEGALMALHLNGRRIKERVKGFRDIEDIVESADMGIPVAVELRDHVGQQASAGLRVTVRVQKGEKAVW